MATSVGLHDPDAPSHATVHVTLEANPGFVPDPRFAPDTWGGDGYLLKLLSGFDQTDQFHALADYVSSLKPGLDDTPAPARHNLSLQQRTYLLGTAQA